MTSKGVTTTKKVKRFNQSPLPFQGQKRNFVKLFRECLIQYDESYTYVDLFGGSGLLSQNVKATYPGAKVVYNDFDQFSKRLKQIPQTNTILAKLRLILEHTDRKGKIVGKYREQVVEMLKQEEKRGYSDWITLSSNLLFSMNYATTLQSLIKETMYNKVRLSDYDATGYLQGVKIISSDYKEVFNQYKNKARVVFLVDPPYLSTDSATYMSDGYWRLQDYLNVLQVLTDHDYFYFTSNKSQIVELCEWISTVSTTANPFAKATRKDVITSTSHNAKYTDIMFHYKNV